MSISIIIVTYNSQTEINSVLKSIFSSNNKGGEIIVVDNASRDKTTAIIRKNFPSVNLIINKKNLGFAKAANQGAKKARGGILLFLNPDTKIFPDTIFKIIQFAQIKKIFGAIGGQVLNTDGSVQPSCGCFPTLINIVADRIPKINTLFPTELIRQKNYYRTEQSPDWLSGVFFLTPKKLFQKLHGFDEQYFLYLEDVDYCYRLNNLRYPVYYFSEAKIVHKNQGKLIPKKAFKAYQIRRGFSIFFTKFKSPVYCLIWHIILQLESIF